MKETSLADLDRAWVDREEEAATLAGHGFLATALSLRIYAIEIRVKTLICRRLKLEYLPGACKTHDLSELLIFTGFSAELDDPSNDLVRQSWNRVAEFSKKRLNDARYKPRMTLSANESEQLLAALDDTERGVIAWLSRPR